MITKPQQKWLDHLSDTDVIKVVPYDTNSPLLFDEAKKLVVEALGNNFDVLHRGASYLKISGQDEIDIYIPVAASDFDSTVIKMKKVFSEPGSLYPLVRARFRLQGFNKHIDVFVINKEDKNWTDSEKFTDYLLRNPEMLDKYRKLKEGGSGMSVKAYYTQKIEFINEILLRT